MAELQLSAALWFDLTRGQEKDKMRENQIASVLMYSDVVHCPHCRLLSPTRISHLLLYPRPRAPRPRALDIQNDDGNRNKNGREGRA